MPTAGPVDNGAAGNIRASNDGACKMRGACVAIFGGRLRKRGSSPPQTDYESG